MQGEFSFFWSILVPAAMAIVSVVITYALYKHFADKVNQKNNRQELQ